MLLSVFVRRHMCHTHTNTSLLLLIIATLKPDLQVSLEWGISYHALLNGYLYIVAKSGREFF